MSDVEDELLRTIHILNTRVWRNRVDVQTIEGWLQGFGEHGRVGSQGRLHALYLLSRFMFFGDEEVRALLRSLYRDKFRYPIVSSIRSSSNHTVDEKIIQPKFKEALGRSRFLAMGNPSESGAHLLYHYRQENDLDTRVFINSHEIFALKSKQLTLADPKIERYVFIDDFCGSGSQAVRTWKAMKSISEAAARAGVKPKVNYHVLVGTAKGLARVRAETRFDDIECVLELDNSFRVFDPSSRYFKNPPKGVARDAALKWASKFGTRLQGKDDALGFGDGQLLLGFIHNTPNNTLPIFWHQGSSNQPWAPPFRRYYKLKASNSTAGVDRW